MPSSLKIIKNNLPKLKEALTKVSKQEVLVGVPAENSNRKSAPGEKQAMNNATLAYIHDNGSAAANIPARPFMRPGITRAKARIAETLGLSAKQAINGDGSIDKGLMKAGLIAQLSIREVINEGVPPELAPNTIKARQKRGRTGTRPLIDTGQLRNAINFVVKEK